MATIKHAFTCAIADDPDAITAGQVVPSEWNAAHTVTAASNTLLGRATAETGEVEEITLGFNLTFNGTTLNANGEATKAYATLVLANDDLANIPAYSLIWINSDTTAANNGYWAKTGNSGTTLVQTTYDRVSLLETRTTGLELTSIPIVPTGKNLIDSNALYVGTKLNTNGSGALLATSGWFTTHMIAVNPSINSNIYVNLTKQVAQYDENKQFIAGTYVLQGTGPMTITLNSAARFIRLSHQTTAAVMATCQAEYGTSGTAFEYGSVKTTTPEGGSVKTLSTDVLFLNSSVQAQYTNFTAIGKNLLNPRNVTNGFYVSNTTGVVTAGGTYYVSDPIYVTPGLNYVYTKGRNMAFYNVSGVFISGVAVVDYATPLQATAPAGAVTLRVSSQIKYLPNNQLEIGSSATPYEVFDFNLPDIQIHQANLAVSEPAIGEMCGTGLSHPMGAALAMSFDGTYASYLDAAQIIASYGGRATFFIQGATIDYGVDYLTSADLAAMEALGMEIGNHSMTHAVFTTLTPSEMIAEVNDCYALLRDAGVEYPGGFAYPVGPNDDITNATLRQVVPYARLVSGAIGSYSASAIDRSNVRTFHVPGMYYADPSTEVNRLTWYSRLRDAKHRGYVLPLFMHSLEMISGSTLEAGALLLHELCKQCRAIGLPIIAFREALHSYNLASICDWNFANLDMWAITSNTTVYTYTLDTSEKYAGDSSLKVLPNGSSGTQYLSVAPAIGMGISVREGQTLSVSFRINITDVLVGTGLTLGVNYYDRTSTLVMNLPIAASVTAVTSGWTALSGSVIVPTDVYTMYPQVKCAYTSGTAYIDMLEVIDTLQDVLK